MSIEERVRDHFHADAQRFDAIYDDTGSAMQRLVDRIWRGVVRKRLDLTLEHLGDLNGQSVLDVGCGSGRYCLAYAGRGASRVLGIDFAPEMIRIARDLAARVGAQERCEFRVGSFPESVPETDFDHSTALGFFDYVPDPVRMVAEMRSRTRRTMIMSFPRAIEWRVPFRRLRFSLMRCPLFLYTGARARQVLVQAGVRDYEWIPLDRDFLVVART